MIGTTQNFSARIAVKGLLCATVLALVLIEMLVLVSNANASATEATIQQEGATPAPEITAPVQEAVTPSEGVAGGVTSTSTEGTATTQESSDPAQETPSGEGSTAGSAETTPAETTHAESTPPSEESTPPASQELLPVKEAVQTTLEPEVGQTTQETVPPVEDVLVPVTNEVVPPAVEVVSPIASEERVKPTESAKEATQAEAIAAPIAVGSPPPPSTPQAALTVVASTPTPVVAAGPLATLTTLSPIPATELQERSAHSGSGVGVAPLTAAQRADELSCQLSGLTKRMSEDCSAALLSDSSLLAVASVEPVAETSPAHKSTHAGGGYSEPAGGGRSVLPPPGPAPGGSVGGSAAAGSGLALSGFFTLAGLLLFAAPCAMRRLRLSCRPWRTAFFVLIPERPG